MAEKTFTGTITSPTGDTFPTGPEGLGTATIEEVAGDPPSAPAQASPAKAPPFTIGTAKSKIRYVKALIYGPYGGGKTTLAAQAQDVPAMQDVLFLDTEAGSRSIRNREDIDLVTITSYATFAEAFKFLRLHCRLRDEGNEVLLAKLESMFKQVPVKEIKRPKHYNTVIIDTLTEVQKLSMYRILGVQVSETELDMPLNAPAYKEWGQSIEMIRLLIRSFRDLPMHVLLVCASQVEKDDMSRFYSFPALPGKLANESLGFMDLVGYLEAGVPRGVEAGAATSEGGGGLMRRLWVSPGYTHKAKNRFRNFKGVYIDNPNMAQLWKLSTE